MSTTLTPPQPPPAAPSQSGAPAPSGRSGRTPRGRREIETRSLVIDLVGLGLLGTLGIFGFKNAYGGSRFFLAGVVGLLAGMAVAWFGARIRLGTLPTAASAVAVYFVLGGVVVAPSETLFGFMPKPASLAAVANGTVAGWARLLTSVPPVGNADNLLAVPFLCGVLCGLLALTVTLRTRRPLPALLFPTAVLAVGILFGTQVPASLLLQGSAFAVVALAWASYRYQAKRRIDTGRRRSTRWVGIVAMLGLAAVISAWIGDAIPGAGRPRMVLRDDVEPPFDPSDYPSPLVGYRRFTNGPSDKASQNDETSKDAEVDGWRHTELFEVTGLPKDEPLRLATLDTYSDGIVYEVGTGQASSGYFRRVGDSVKPQLGDAKGKERSAEIRVLDGLQLTSDGAQDPKKEPSPYSDIWLPLPQNPTSVTFDGEDSERNKDLRSSLRLNETTGAAAVPLRVRAGDQYKVTFLDVDQPKMHDIGDLEGLELNDYQVPAPYKVQQVIQQAQRFSDGHMDCQSAKGAEASASDKGGSTEANETVEASTSVEHVWMIGQNLNQCGGLDDGDQSQGGHNAARLSTMMEVVLQGNGEQFAPLAALMADSIGVDARVVMGFRSQSDSDKWRKENLEKNPGAGLKPSNGGPYRVAGVDIDAWIEINIKGYGWVPIDVTPNKPDPVKLPQPESQAPLNEPPPPPPSLPPSDDTEVDISKVAKNNSCATNPDSAECNEGGIPWGAILKWISIPLAPFAMVALVTGFIAWLKARRRNRRRQQGTPDVRVKGGWDEVTDLACDMGSPVPSKATRREAAGLIGNDDAKRLAGHADGAVFGPNNLGDVEVERYWNEVDAARQSMVNNLSRFGRWKVLVSLSSLRLASQRNRAARRLARSQGRTTPRKGGRRTSSGVDRPGTSGSSGTGGFAEAQRPAAVDPPTGFAPDLGGGLR